MLKNHNPIDNHTQNSKKTDGDNIQVKLEFADFLSIKKPELYICGDDFLKSIFHDYEKYHQINREKIEKIVIEKNIKNPNRYRTNRITGNNSNSQQTPLEVVQQIKHTLGNQFDLNELINVFRNQKNIVRLLSHFNPEEIKEKWGEALIYIIYTLYHKNGLDWPTSQKYEKVFNSLSIFEGLEGTEITEKANRILSISGGELSPMSLLKTTYLIKERNNMIKNINIDYSTYIIGNSNKINMKLFSVEFIKTRWQYGRGWAEGYPIELDNKEVELYLDNGLGVIVKYADSPLAVIACGTKDFETLMIQQMQKISYEERSIHGYQTGKSYHTIAQHVKRQEVLYDVIRQVCNQYGFSKLQIQSGENNERNNKIRMHTLYTTYTDSTGKIHHRADKHDVVFENNAVHLEPDIAKKIYDDFAQSKGFTRLENLDREKNIVPIRVCKNIGNS